MLVYFVPPLVLFGVHLTWQAIIYIKNRNKREEHVSNPFVNASDLEPQWGDLIEIRRPLYSHFCVYVEEGFVIHISEGRNKRGAQVKKDKLVSVAGKSLCRVNNLEEAAQRRNLTARSVEEIIKTAEEMVNNKKKYRIFHDNCEHFATYCRYGTGFSLQAESVENDSELKLLARGVGYTSLNVGTISQRKQNPSFWINAYFQKDYDYLRVYDFLKTLFLRDLWYKSFLYLL